MRINPLYNYPVGQSREDTAVGPRRWVPDARVLSGEARWEEIVRQARELYDWRDPQDFVIALLGRAIEQLGGNPEDLMP